VWPALLVVLATTATFGLFVPRFGLYYDDYPSWSLYLAEGTSAVVAFAGGQARPLVGLLPALAGSPTGSHWLMLIVHTLNALLFLALLRRIWPGVDRATGVAAVLFCVYPAYWLRPTHIALAIDGSLLLALLSLWIGLLALDRSGPARAAFTALSALLVPAYLLLYELPVGLELLRPLIIALDRRRAGMPASGRRLLSLSAPWLACLALFATWRLLVFRPAGDYERLQYNVVALPSTLADVASLGARLLSSTTEVLLGPWLAILAPRGGPFDPTSLPLAAGLAGTLVFAVGLWLRRTRGPETPGARVAGEMAVIGILIVMAGQVPPLATGKAVDTEGMFSRWTLVSTLGASLAWAALAAARPRATRISRVVGLAGLALVGLGGFRHVENSLAFARDWETQRRTWWQLEERMGMPSRGTLVVLDETWEPALGRTRYEYELTLSAELFFGRDAGVVASTSEHVAYQRSRNPRSFRLMGRAWQVDVSRMVLALEGTGCLELAAPDRGRPVGKDLSPSGQVLIPIAKEPVLAPSADHPATRRLFGPEPDDWCRRYQAARREEQRGNDEAVVRIGEDAWARGLRPEVESEWGVFRQASQRSRGRDFPPGARP
jgi:hypothetical protein